MTLQNCAWRTVDKVVRSEGRFSLVIDWIMKTSTSEGKHGIQWTSRMQLDDLDFADDLALLSQTQQQMQKKTNSVAAASAAVGLNIHKGKSRILQYNTACTSPITTDGEDLEDVHRSSGQCVRPERAVKYSDREEENTPHTQRVALMVSKEARNALVRWESHGSRIIKASFNKNKNGITMNAFQ
ncbi:unnamed protein product [Schistosoma curassoni]|uniref:Reverse transcriptase domain-containing protein n=1 Tax=Schistosoma curassoni TaxID=6186 RepID=A0A183KW44_9TREM|nr:unnamed protein product [Schistosoma curassoni]